MNNSVKKITINTGDTLANIANEVLGDYSDWRSLAYVNNLDIFDELPVGQNLTIPNKDEVTKIIDQGVNELQNINSEVQTTVREILNTRAGGTISKILGVDESKLLEDLDLSSLAQSLSNSIPGSSTAEWTLLSWVL